MSLKELGELYQESSWAGKLTQSSPLNNAGWSKNPGETEISKSYKGSFGRGGSDYNPVSTPVYEQEEENGAIGLINKELSKLDSKSPTDRVAIDCLSRIKQKLSS